MIENIDENDKEQSEQDEKVIKKEIECTCSICSNEDEKNSENEEVMELEVPEDDIENEEVMELEESENDKENDKQE